MLSIDSKLWQVRSYDGVTLLITQRASGAIRSMSRSALPSTDELAAMSERRFDAVCREAFHKTAGGARR